MVIFEKLKEVRGLLKLTQPEFAKETRWTQSSISNMEKGLKKFPPIRVLIFLQSKGVNMNALFDETIGADEFVRNFRHRSLVPSSIPAECAKCEGKDREITHLENHLKTMSVLVDTLRGENELGKRGASGM